VFQVPVPLGVSKDSPFIVLLYKVNIFPLRSFSQEKFKKPETHYEVLNVRNDCSTREVRNAFVQLSKLVGTLRITQSIG